MGLTRLRYLVSTMIGAYLLRHAHASGAGEGISSFKLAPAPDLTSSDFVEGQWKIAPEPPRISDSKYVHYKVMDSENSDLVYMLHRPVSEEDEFLKGVEIAATAYANDLGIFRVKLSETVLLPPERPEYWKVNQFNISDISYEELFKSGHGVRYYVQTPTFPGFVSLSNFRFSEDEGDEINNVRLARDIVVSLIGGVQRMMELGFVHGRLGLDDMTTTMDGSRIRFTSFDKSTTTEKLENVIREWQQIPLVFLDLTVQAKIDLDVDDSAVIDALVAVYNEQIATMVKSGSSHRECAELALETISGIHRATANSISKDGRPTRGPRI